MSSLPGLLSFPLGGDIIPVELVPAVDLWARDLLEIRFPFSVLNDSVLQSPATYTITSSIAGNLGSPLAFGLGVSLATTNFLNVDSVRTGNQLVLNRIFLIVAPPDPNTSYFLSFSPINTPSGLVETFPSCVFVGRPTKIDSMLSTRPQRYDTRPQALLRHVLNAIGREDDRIGGARHDQITPNIFDIPII